MKCNDAGKDIIFNHAAPRTEEEQLELLRAIRKAERAVRAGLNVTPNENEYSALVSFAQSMGSMAFWRSDVRVLVNRKSWFEAAEAMTKHVKRQGTISAALIVRRREERALFTRPVIVANNGKVVA